MVDRVAADGGRAEAGAIAGKDSLHSKSRGPWTRWEHCSYISSAG